MTYELLLRKVVMQAKRAPCSPTCRATPRTAKLMSAITLKYASRRSEVWQWYWSLWRRRLWIRHAYYLMCILVIAIALDGHWPPNTKTISFALLIAAAVIALFIAVPQLMFKPEERTLIVSEGGLDTKIGRKSGTVKWDDITAIQDSQDVTAVVRKNGRAFLIPRRAFNSEKERSDFLALIKSWQARAGS